MSTMSESKKAGHAPLLYIASNWASYTLLRGLPTDQSELPRHTINYQRSTVPTLMTGKRINTCQCTILFHNYFTDYHALYLLWLHTTHTCRERLLAYWQVSDTVISLALSFHNYDSIYTHTTASATLSCIFIILVNPAIVFLALVTHYN